MCGIASRTYLVALTLILSSSAHTIFAQESPAGADVAARDLWDSNLLNKRPPGKHKVIPKTLDDALIGITLWKLRPSNSSDNSAVRSLIHEDDQTRLWTPERISAETLLHEGDKVRISIEAARTGYLYVVDSDEYQDGSTGDAYLIFPTLRIRGGDNSVSAGTLVEIPSQDDTPPYFKMRRSRRDQASEMLTILVSPKPIEGLQIERNKLRLNADQVARWKKQCGHTATKLENSGNTGTPYTLAEKAAGNAEKKLNQDDPLPQTIYHVDAKAGQPLLVEVQLRIAP